MIENYQLQKDKICSILKKSLCIYDNKIEISYYNPFIIKSGIFPFDNNKIYADTSSVEGINNISSIEYITYNKRPSRANMKPTINTIWFSKMKGSNKNVIITENDNDLIDNYIFSTGFQGIKSNTNFPLSLLTAIIISDDFIIQRDINSVGTTMSGINNETFFKISVPYLTQEEIYNYDRKYSSLVNELSFIRRKINKLNKLKESLLKKYF